MSTKQNKARMAEVSPHPRSREDGEIGDKAPDLPFLSLLQTDAKKPRTPRSYSTMLRSQPDAQHECESVSEQLGSEPVLPCAT